MTLFVHGPFTSSAGLTLPYKIECNALTDTDWQVIADEARFVVGPFYQAVGVPKGGFKLAEAINKIAGRDGTRILVVDDVWTTGGSMKQHARYYEWNDWIGYVAFARGPLPPNVKAFMRTSEA